MAAAALEYDQQMRWRHEEIGLPFEYPPTERTRMSKVEMLGQ